MGAETVQTALLAVICVCAVATLVIVASLLKGVRREQDAANRLMSTRDFGPALHGILQQEKEMNRLLSNIDKRLEKLEALEKVQIASLSMKR